MCARRVLLICACVSWHRARTINMCKQDKSRFTFSKRYFALYEGGLLAYYSHERAFQEDVKKHEGVVRDAASIIYTQAYLLLES